MKSSGPADPTKDTTDDLDGSVSGGRFSVLFDATSSPPVTGLGGTVFAAAVAGPAPALSVADVKVKEGDSGETSAVFQVSLDAASAKPVKVGFETADGTAAAPGDYAAKSGTVEFAPGEKARTITVPVKGDTVDEPDETFAVMLASPTDATIADATGVGTIEDDDAPGGANRPPACSRVVATPNTLLPANHRYRTVVLTGATDPDGDAAVVRVTGVTQDEPLSGLGAGDAAPDARTGAPGSVLLRAERDPHGDGRVYRVTFTATDPGGLSCQASVAVSVPLDSKHVAVDSGQTVDSFGVAHPACLSGPLFPAPGGRGSAAPPPGSADAFRLTC